MADNSPSRWSATPPAPTGADAPLDESLFSLEPVRNWLGYTVRSVRRHLVLALATAVVIVLVGGMFVLGDARSYQTSVTILLRTDGSVTDSGTAVTLDQASRQANGVITRRDSLDQIIDRLALDDHPVRKPVFGRLADGLTDGVLGKPSRAKRRDDLRRELRNALSAEPASGGESILVSVTWGDAKQAKQIADLAFDIFFQDRRVAEITPKKDAVRLLTSQTQEASAQVAVQRQALGLSPQQDAPQGSDLLTAIGVERDLKADLQRAQLALQRAEDGLAHQYALLQPAEVPLKPVSSALPRYAALALLVVLCSAGACVALDQRRGRILEPWQLARYRLRVLATVPLHDRSSS